MTVFQGANRVPALQAPVAMYRQACARTSVPLDAIGPAMDVATSPFGPVGVLTDVVSVLSSQARWKVSMSPAVAAASAVTGHLTDPRTL